MPTSILKINVDDSEFKEFSALWAKYKDELEKTPAAWREVGSAAGDAGGEYDRMTAALLAQQRLLHEQVEEGKRQEKGKAEANKSLREAEKQEREAEARRRRSNQEAIAATKQIAKNVADTAKSLLEWVGIGSILGGLMGAGGLWGLDRLADMVGGQRRSAQGFGVSTGQLQALDLNFQRYFDVRGALGNVAEASNDPSKAWTFSALGINRSGKDNAQLLLEAQRIIAEQSKLINANVLAPYAQARGWTQIFSMDEIRRLRSVSAGELRTAQGEYGHDVGLFARSDAQSRSWQELSRTMAESGAKIKTAFIDVLTPLTPELKKLSEAVADAIRTFIKSDALKTLIHGLGEGIKHLAEYLNSAEFQKDLKTFAEDAHKFVDAFGQLLDWTYTKLVSLGIIKPSTPGDAATVQAQGIQNNPWLSPILMSPGEAAAKFAAQRADHGANEAGNFSARQRDSNAVDLLTRFGGFGRNAAAGIVANLESEGFNPLAHGDNGAAYGIAQWHNEHKPGQLGRRDEYTRLFGHTMESVRDPRLAMREQLKFLVYELTRGRYKNVGDTLRSGSHHTDTAFGAGAYVSENYEAPKDAVGEAVKRGGRAEVIVRVYNATGSNVSVTGKQVAH